MTKLLKTVSREAAQATDAHRPIIVSLEPGDLIGFRLKGTRHTFRLPVHAAYILAARAEVEASKAAKRGRRRAT